MIFDQNNVRVLKFGTKDIAIAPIQNTVYLAENNQYFDVPEVRGEQALELLKNHSRVVMAFDRVESVDVLIEALQNVKEYLA